MVSAFNQLTRRERLSEIDISRHRSVSIIMAISDLIYPTRCCRPQKIINHLLSYIAITCPFNKKVYKAE